MDWFQPWNFQINGSNRDVHVKPEIEIKIDALIITSKEQNGYQAEVDQPSQSSIVTRTHAGYFRISLSFGTQALLRKVLSEPNYNNGSKDVWHVFRMLPSTAFLLLWWPALLIQNSLSLIYVLRFFFHFNLVKQEFSHYIGTCRPALFKKSMRKFNVAWTWGFVHHRE